MSRLRSAARPPRRGRRAAAYRELVRRYDAYLELLRANGDVLALLGELDERAGAGLGRARFTVVVHRLTLRTRAMVRMLRQLGGPDEDALIAVLERLQGQIETAMERAPAPVAAGPFTAPMARLADLGAEDFGGKAASLARMTAATRVAVPEGFAVAVRGLAAVLAHNRLEGGVQAAYDALDADEPEHLAATAERLHAEMMAASLPPELAEALRGEVAALARGLGGDVRLAVRSSATGEDGWCSYAGQYESVLDVAPDEVEAAYRTVLASFFSPGALLLRLRRGHGALELGMGALVLRMVDARASGVASSRDPIGDDDGPALVEAVPGLGAGLMGGRRTPLRFKVDRESREVETGAAGCGDGVVTQQEVVAAADLALDAERVLGCAADVEWAIDRGGRLWLLQARPLTRARGEAAGAPVAGAELLLEGGACACPGAASGPVVRVRGREQALDLPKGAIAVAAEALPELALGLSRAGAMLAERGGVTGHLAATARELGVPTVLALDGCCELVEGTIVTVDAGAGRVYRGELAELVERRRRQRPAEEPAPAGSWMRRVLELITPLHLTDPAASGFTPAACRSLHDVVRFVHERALSEAVRLGDPAEGSGGGWYRLDAAAPFELRLVPLEGGVTPPAGGRTVQVEAVTSVPAAAFLAGVLDPAVRRSGPPPVDLAGLGSVLARSAFDSDLGEPVWALVAESYLQLSARIGYHFTTLEALVGDHEQANRVRFAFKGGAAGDARRVRRARFIAEVLDGLGFHVERNGDFVAGTFGHADRDGSCRALEGLGRLLVCANRLDMLLGDDRLASQWAAAFLRGDYQSVLDGRSEPAPEA